MTYVLTAAIVVLAINLAVAVAGAARGSGYSGYTEPDAWLLGVLISGTAGAAILAAASQALRQSGLIDAALALMALALVIVAARSAARRAGAGGADAAGASADSERADR